MKKNKLKGIILNLIIETFYKLGIEFHSINVNNKINKIKLQMNISAFIVYTVLLISYVLFNNC